MARRRIQVPDAIRSAVVEAQAGKCALCKISHPIDIHHIMPLHRNGDNTFSNLILLCRNHHDLADAGVLPPELLRYYKRLARTESVILPEDPMILYELTAHNIVRDLMRRYDAELLSLAKSLLERLQRAGERRLKYVCMELIFSIVHCSVHEETPSINSLEKLQTKARRISAELGHDGLLYQQMITHCLGVVYHNSGDYEKATNAFESAVQTSLTISGSNDEMEADASLAHVHQSATEHLSGDSDHALKHLRSVIEKIPTGSVTFADTECFAQIKLAEHMLVRHRFKRAREILEAMKQAAVANGRVLPIYRVILLKDLGRTCSLLGERERGVRYFIQAMALAEEAGFHNQRRKILEVSNELGIEAQEIDPNL